MLQPVLCIITCLARMCLSSCSVGFRCQYSASASNCHFTSSYSPKKTIRPMKHKSGGVTSSSLAKAQLGESTTRYDGRHLHPNRLGVGGTDDQARSPSFGCRNISQ